MSLRSQYRSWKYGLELKRKVAAQQRAKVDAYFSLAENNLPIPRDLKVEVESTRGFTR